MFTNIYRGFRLALICLLAYWVDPKGGTWYWVTGLVPVAVLYLLRNPDIQLVRYLEGMLWRSSH